MTKSALLHFIQNAVSSNVDCCLLWPFAVDSWGYGKLTMGGKTLKAHRVVCSIVYGKMNHNKFAIHSCDTPACVNPKHLSWGDHAENMRQRSERNRVQHGRNHYKSRITETDVVKIRQLLASGLTQSRVAEMFNINQRTVSSINVRNTWKHVK